MSNILEWAQRDPCKLRIAAENLANLLKKDSIAVCSRLIFKAKTDLEEEKKIFQPFFEFEPQGTAYVYKRK